MSGSFGVDLLAFGPHPDDVEIFCGGILARMADLGHSVGVVDLTRGERASNGTPEERAAEAQEAARILGLRFRENLGLPDTGIDPADREQLVRAVEAIRRHRPEIVLIPWREERHPDHEAASALLYRAAFYAGVRGFETPGLERFVPRQVLQYAMRFRMSPSFVVDTSAVAERKRQAIACYGSQLGRRPGSVPTLVASGTIEAIEARDRYYGSMIGVSHGEPLRSVAVMGIADLVRHFRENPFDEAHAFEPRG